MSQFQLYHSTKRVAAQFEVTERTVREWARAGLFSDFWLELPNGELRIAGSGLDHFIQHGRHRAVIADEPIAARSPGEFLRKYEQKRLKA